MAQKENQRIALTRRLLQEGLLRLLAHEQLDQISVTALCKEAGVNRATFYNHYTSPSELLNEMELQLISEVKELSGHPNSIEDITNNFERICIKLREKADLVRILVRYHADQDLEDIIIQMARHYGSTRLNLHDTQMDADSLHLVSTFVYSGCYTMIQEWLVRDIQKTPREIAELALSIINKEYL